VIALPPGTTAQQLLDGVENNKTTYNVLYFFFHFGVFYWNLRQEIHKGNVNAVSYAWIYSWPLFYVTNKYHQYEKLCVNILLTQPSKKPYRRDFAT